MNRLSPSVRFYCQAGAVTAGLVLVATTGHIQPGATVNPALLVDADDGGQRVSRLLQQPSFQLEVAVPLRQIERRWT